MNRISGVVSPVVSVSRRHVSHRPVSRRPVSGPQGAVCFIKPVACTPIMSWTTPLVGTWGSPCATLWTMSCSRSGCVVGPVSGPVMSRWLGGHDSVLAGKGWNGSGSVSVGPACNSASGVRGLRLGLPELDEETKKEKERKKRIIIERMRRSTLYDSLRGSEDKLFHGSDTPLSDKEAFWFPPLEVMGASGPPFSLADAFQGKVTLVTVSFQARGKAQLPPWHAAWDTWVETLTPEEAARVSAWDVVYLEGAVFSLFKGLLRRTSITAAPEATRDRTILRFEKSTPGAEDFADAARIHNRVMGYAFLIDEQQRVRWRAHGDAEPSEMEGMAMVASTMLDDL